MYHVFRETDSSPVASIVRQRDLRLYGHVARYPEADPAYQVFSEMDNPAWRRPRGHPQKLLAAESRCLLLGVTTHYEKGACVETRETDRSGVIGWARRRVPRRMPLMIV